MVRLVAPSLSRLLVVAAVLLSVSLPAQAARYELKEGHQYALCRDYVAALNAAKRKFPMACERHFPPEFDKFSKPKWTPLDPKAKPKEFYRELYFLWYGRIGYKKASEEGWRSIWKDWIKPAIDAGTFQLDRAKVDVVSLGERVTLLRFAYHPCRESQEFFEKGPHEETYRYLVLDEESGKLHKGYEGLTNTERGMFYYEGRTFMDSFSGVAIEWLNKPWRKSGDASGHLTIVEPRGPVAPAGTPWRPGGSGFGFRQVCVVGVYYELPGSEIENETRNEQ